jgi:VRR-NUC domain
MVNEETLQVAVIDAMHALGWLVAHFRPARTARGEWRTPVSADGKGFPDIVAAHIKQKRLLAVELKGTKGRLSPDQVIWAEHFQAVAETTVAVEYHLWTPADWSENVIRILTAAP